MPSKLAPPEDWSAYYRIADERRRRAGWHRRGPSKPKRAFDHTRMLVIAMALAAAIIVVCLAIPN
jgi:hypothetical protein